MSNNKFRLSEASTNSNDNNRIAQASWNSSPIADLVTFENQQARSLDLSPIVESGHITGNIKAGYCLKNGNPTMFYILPSGKLISRPIEAFNRNASNVMVFRAVCQTLAITHAEFSHLKVSTNNTAILKWMRDMRINPKVIATIKDDLNLLSRLRKCEQMLRSKPSLVSRFFGYEKF